MSDGDSAHQARGFRDHTASHPPEAARSADPVRRDTLLQEAVARVNEVRRLLDQLEEAFERLGASHSTTGNG